MAVAGWIVDKSVAARSADPKVAEILKSLVGRLCVCPIGQLEQLYSARSAKRYDEIKSDLANDFELVAAPPDVFERALSLQRDLAHHHGMWHRTPIADLLIAETALHHGLGVAHVDRDYERIAEVPPRRTMRIAPPGRRLSRSSTKPTAR